MAVSICIVSWNRPQELQCLLRSIHDNLQQGPVHEILILDNGSSPPYELTSVPEVLSDKLRIIRSETNLGCPAGRNLLAREASAPLLFFIDDDGVLENESDIGSAIEWLSSDQTLMAVTGLVTEDHRTRTRTPWRFRKHRLLTATRKNAPGFIGGCVILKREHFLALGGFSEAGRFGGEEALLSIQALLAGRTFGFTSDFELAHEPSPEGRLTKIEVGVANLTNRLVMASHFGYPMRLTLITSAILSNLRRVGLRTLAYAFDRNLPESASAQEPKSPRIRLSSWRLLRTLGWRGWI
jgi:GT2 family glycosyltransferase